MYKKAFSYLNTYSIKRGIFLASLVYTKEVYDRHCVKKSLIKPEELSEELLKTTKCFEKTIVDISTKCKTEEHTKEESDEMPDPRIVWTNGDNLARYDYTNNLIILSAKQADKINNFVIAHEYAHYKLDQPKKYDDFLLMIAATLAGTAPIPASLIWSTVFGILFMPTLIEFGCIANGNVVEDRADKFALRMGYAKEGHELFQKENDNYADLEHPLFSLRRAQAFEALHKQSQDESHK
jgi:hypothetical protein